VNLSNFKDYIDCVSAIVSLITGISAFIMALKKHFLFFCLMEE